MNPTRVRTLGAYVSVVALFQFCIYIALPSGPGTWGWLVYFDPRIGLLFVEATLRGSEPAGAGVLQWLSALWLAALGVLMLTGRAPVVTYIASEIVLAGVTVLFFIMIAAANLSPSHGFSVGELFFPVIAMLFVTAIPLWLAFRCFSKGETVEQLNLNAGGQV